MEDTWRLTRRRLLASQWSVVTLAMAAGCVDGGDRPGTGGQDTAEMTPTEPPEGSTDPAGSETSTEEPPSGNTDPAGADDLDLREANVVDVSFEDRDGTYGFDVTLHHDDDGEEGYANWWQVERLDGTRLGRRELLHPHAQQPFTRSETLEIPTDVTCVVVRGHDQTHGYGGLAVLVELDSGATRSLDQGPERRSFDASECP